MVCFRLLWNHGATLLSLAINILMLVTWKAPLSLADLDGDSPPDNSTVWTEIRKYVLGGILRGLQ